VNSEEINQLVDSLSVKLGVAAEQLMPIAETMIQEQISRSWVMVVSVSLIGLIAVAALVSSLMWSLRKAREDGELVFPGLLVVAISAFILLVPVAVELTGAIRDLVSPNLTLLRSLL